MVSSPNSQSSQLHKYLETEKERERNGFDRITEESTQLPLVSLNHVSFVCRSVRDSVRFYEEVLGFTLIKRPSSFKFEGAWLFNFGIGIHLLECNSPEDVPKKKGPINPKDNHISFQCSNIGLVIRKLEEMGVDYVTAVVEEGGIKVDQLFFHDPDGYMVEIYNCNNLPVLPLSSCPLKRPKCGPIEETNFNAYGNEMMERLVKDVMNISC